jgi:uncharacterized membrane protein YfcA
VQWIAVMLIGAACGLLGGALGKGGSAVATPLLAAVGIPAIVAVAAPLPATIPGTLAAGRAYVKAGLVDWRIVRACVVTALPATIIGAIATRWVDASALIVVTDAVVIGIGLRLANGASSETASRPPVESTAAIGAVGAVVGLASGLLANSGGFLLAPLFITVLRFPVKRAFATSLAVATMIAIPATLVHTALGHIDWAVVAVFAAASVPLSAVGARIAIRTDPRRLERVAGVLLATLAGGLLAIRLV